MPTAACVIDASPKHVSRKVQAAGGRSCDVRKNRWRGRPADRSAALPIWKSLGNRRLQNIPAAAAATAGRGRGRVRAPRSTSDNRRFPAGPRTTSRPLPGRARSAAPTARKKCTGHMRARVCVYILHAYACIEATSHRDTKGLEAHDCQRSHSRSRSRLHRVAAGVSARGIVGLSRASGPHTIVTRSATARRRGTTERFRAASSCCNFQRPRLSSPARNAYRALSTLIVLYRLVLVGLRVPSLKIIPLVPPAFEQLWPLRAGEISPLNSARGESTLTAMCRIAVKNGRWLIRLTSRSWSYSSLYAVFFHTIIHFSTFESGTAEKRRLRVFSCPLNYVTTVT